MNDPSGEFHFDFQRQPRANRPSDEETTVLNQSQNSEATQAFPTSSNPVLNTAATPETLASPASLGETQAMPPLWDLEDFAAPGTAPSAVQPTQAMPQKTSAAQQPTQAMPQPTQAFPTMPTPPAASSTPDQLQATQAMPTQLQATQAMPQTAPATQSTIFGNQADQPTQVFTPDTAQPRVAGQTTPRTITASAQPTILTPTIPPNDHDDAKQDGTAPNKKARKLSNGKIAGIVIAAIAVVALIVAGVMFFRSNSGKLAYAACTGAQSSYNDTVKKLNAEATQAQQNAPAASTVDNQQTLTTLNQAIANASSVTTTASCSADMKANELKTNTTSFKNATKQAKEARKAIQDALEAANSSKDAKDVNALKADLNATISNAQNVLNNSAGQVADENTRTALQNAISNANNVAGQSTPAQSDVNNAKSQLQKAASDVNASISAKQQADAETQRKQQEQQNAANQNQNQNQNQNSTNSGQSSQNQNAQCDDSADGTCQTGNGND